MQPKSKSAKLFVEITCMTSPYPGCSFMVGVPHVALAGSELKLQGSQTGEDIVPEAGVLPRLREIELIDGYRNYKIVRRDRRVFITFVDVFIDDPKEFYDYAKAEISRINRILGAALPNVSEIKAGEEVYASPDENVLSIVWRVPPTFATSPQVAIVEKQAIVDDWNAFLAEVNANGAERIFMLLDLEMVDPIARACIQLIGENAFPSLFKVYEIISKQYGGQHKVKQLGVANDRELSRFTDNAQSYRHANYELSTTHMDVMEAKLLMIKLLWFYVQDDNRPASN
jgi:hypothetical protein